MRLGFWASIGVLLQWVVVVALGGVRFVFWWCFVVVVLWRHCVGLGLCFGGVLLWWHWVCCGGIVVVCNGNTKQL